MSADFVPPTTQAAAREWLAVHLYEFDALLDEMFELRAQGAIDDQTASQAHVDIRLLQDLAADALADGDFLTRTPAVMGACGRLITLALTGSLF